MSFDLYALLRDNIKTIKPYSSARDEFAGQAKIFLDANENALGSVGDIMNNRYPDPHQRDLKNEIARIMEVKSEQIFLGNGSDEAIDLTYRIFCEPGHEKALIMPPTYGMYRVCADINDVEIVEVLLRPDFEIDTEKVLDRLNNDPSIKLVFICSPNNPTANSFRDEDIRRLLLEFNGIVVIDEAYQDFSSRTSWAKQLSGHPNLIVLQTFSKAWGLSNIRLGIAFASPEIIGVFDKVKPPYNVNGVTQQTALEALKYRDRKLDMVDQIKSERDRLMEKLKEMPIIEQVYPSDANFVLVRARDASAFYNHLLADGIVVRDRSTQPLLAGCLRITVGSPEENQALLASLKGLR
jgi:histidinol-phosphate aminotransferase